jgi:hypothetical protein
LRWVFLWILGPKSPHNGALEKRTFFGLAHFLPDKYLRNKGLFRTVNLCSNAPAGPLRVTLESLACTLATAPPDALTTALQGYLAQHPEQAAELRRVLVEALGRDFVGWDRVRALIASLSASSTAAEQRSEGCA